MIIFIRGRAAGGQQGLGSCPLHSEPAPPGEEKCRCPTAPGIPTALCTAVGAAAELPANCKIRAKGERLCACALQSKLANVLRSALVSSDLSISYFQLGNDKIRRLTMKIARDWISCAEDNLIKACLKLQVLGPVPLLFTRGILRNSGILDGGWVFIGEGGVAPPPTFPPHLPQYLNQEYKGPERVVESNRFEPKEVT